MAYLTKKPFTREDKTLEKYLQEIGEVEVLTKKQEIEVTREIKKGNPKALEQLIKANLRFVISVAKQYQNQGMFLGDLINEGNLGLIKAAKRFDETKGFKFISYAVWWIRQAILSALANNSRIVRLPLNRVGDIYKIGKISTSLEQKFGRSPSPNEIADELDLETEKVAETLKISSRHLSLDAPFKNGEDNKLLDVFEDKHEPVPDNKLIKDSLNKQIQKVLSTLTEREAEVINLYYGINRERPMTLEEIGKVFDLTRERVRQIKVKALKRLRHPSRVKLLNTYLIK